MSETIDNSASIEKLEQIIVETEQLFKRSKPMELSDRMMASSRLKEAMGLVSALKTETTPIIKTQEPLVAEEPAATINEAISNRDALSVEIRASLNKHSDLKRVLSMAIPNKDGDKTIVSISASPRPNQKIQNLFSLQNEYIELVFCTNSQAYVVSRSESGMYSVTAAKYWKVPEFTTNQPVQK